MENSHHLTFRGILCKTAMVHTITYFAAGLTAMLVFDYASLFSETSLSALMRPTTDPLVQAGVLFQPLRGLLFGVVFYLLRDIVFRRKNGWLVAWIMLVVVGIISTFGPTPGSIEGLIYTKLSLADQLGGGLLEVLMQSFLLSALTCYWVNHSEKKWLSGLFGAAFFIAMALPVLGLLAAAAGK